MNVNTKRFAICGAALYDGSGDKPRVADVLVEGERIKAVEAPGVLDLKDTEIIRANSLALAPGFIDVHAHSDTTIIARPNAESKISQGVTTDIVGNCGSSSAVRKREYMGYQWEDVESYGKVIDAVCPGLNIATLAGHGSIRGVVQGDEDIPMTDETLKKMRALLEKSLEQGAVGFSSGLIYIPGKFSKTEELLALAPVLKGTRKPYATHMRSEGNQLIEATQEAIAIAKAGDARLQVSHIKTSGRANWSKFDTLMATLAQGRADGLQITADRYPYIYSRTGLRMTLPEPFNSIPEIVKYLNEHPEADDEIKALWKKGVKRANWERIVLCYTNNNAAHEEYFGLDFVTIGKKMGKAPEDAYLDILKNATNSQAMYGSMSEENLERFIQQPWLMPGSDGYAMGPDYELQHAHPRSFGTFPRFFKYAAKFFDYEEVVRRMTSLPASVFNLKERGRVLPGYYADLVLFDPEWMNAEMDFSDMHKFSTGVLKTFVAGGLAYDRANPDYHGRFGRFIKA